MKRVRIIFHQLKRCYQNHRAFFSFYVLAQFVAICIVFYAAASIQSVFVKEQEIDQYKLNFEVDLMRYSDTETEQSLIGYQHENGVFVPQYAEVAKGDDSHTLSLTEMQNAIEKVLSESNLPNLKNIWVSGIYRDYSFGVVLYNPSLAEPSDTVRLNRMMFPEAAAGTDISFGNHTYQISAVTEEITKDILFPPNSIPSDVQCRLVRFCYEQPPNTAEAEEMQAILNRHFQIGSLTIPPIVDPLEAQFHMTVLLCTALVLLAVLINICYAQLFRFSLERKTFAIYRLCGASNQNVCQICLCECALLATVLYLMSAVLFHTLLRPAISGWYQASSTLYTIRFYGVMGIAYLVFQTVLLMVPLSRVINRQIVQEERGGTV